MKINELIGEFGIWTSIAERTLLQKLSRPIPMSSLSEQDQFTIEGMIRKSLVTKIGSTNPKVVANAQNEKT
jgi:hypothetical protein